MTWFILQHFNAIPTTQPICQHWLLTPDWPAPWMATEPSMAVKPKTGSHPVMVFTRWMTAAPETCDFHIHRTAGVSIWIYIWFQWFHNYITCWSDLHLRQSVMVKLHLIGAQNCLILLFGCESCPVHLHSTSGHSVYTCVSRISAHCGQWDKTGRHLRLLSWNSIDYVGLKLVDKTPAGSRHPPV